MFTVGTYKGRIRKRRRLLVSLSCKSQVCNTLPCDPTLPKFSMVEQKNDSFVRQSEIEVHENSMICPLHIELDNVLKGAFHFADGNGSCKALRQGDRSILISTDRPARKQTARDRILHDTALRGRRGSGAKVEKTWMFKTRYVGNDLYGQNTVDLSLVDSQKRSSTPLQNSCSSNSNSAVHYDVIRHEFKACKSLQNHLKQVAAEVCGVIEFVPSVHTFPEGQALHLVRFNQTETRSMEAEPVLLKSETSSCNKANEDLVAAVPRDGTSIFSPFCHFNVSNVVRPDEQIGLLTYGNGKKIKCAPLRTLLKMRRQKNTLKGNDAFKVSRTTGSTV